MEKVLDFLNNNVLVFDGAMGTMLQQKGWNMKESSELLNLSHKDWVNDIHKEYIDAGAKVILTNTFMCNIFNEEKYNYKVEDVITESINIARDAINNREIYLALSVGPSGEFFKIGEKNLERVRENFIRIAKKAEKEKVDIILLETFIHLEEVEIALKAMSEHTTIPLFCTMSTLGKDSNFKGFTVEDMCKVIEANKGSVLGINCSNSPDNLYDIVNELIKYSNIPVMVKANSGLEKNLSNDESAENFARDINNFIDFGVKVVGGCCGTNPKYIKKVNEFIKDNLK